MLVIRRKPGQSIRIGDEIEIEILESGPQRVKLGITAPRDLTVTRSEVELTRSENLSAAQLSARDFHRVRDTLLRLFLADRPDSGE